MITHLTGDCRKVLLELPDKKFQVCVTSPPYWSQRDYGHPDQIGQEEHLEEYLRTLVYDVFEQVKRVLRDDGTLWVNIADCYAGARQNGKQNIDTAASASRGGGKKISGQKYALPRRIPKDCKPKDLCLIPEQFAIEMRKAGWYVRRDIIWEKPNPMPQSMKDRCSTAHEYVWHFAKSEEYFYDWFAIAEDMASGPSDIRKMQERQDRLGGRIDGSPLNAANPLSRIGRKRAVGDPTLGRNKRSVWRIATVPLSEPHYAAFPPGLAEPCLLAGSAPRACEVCGAPWQRMIDQRSVDRTELPADHPEYRPGAGGNGKYSEASEINSGSMAGRRGKFIEARTIGWEPTCHCVNEGTARCQVLDPFGGAGTTGLVADRLGLDATLIELVPESVSIAQRRLHRDAPLFHNL